ncbi:2468_t:CDS:1 [Acaulospora morrowiae]|uniref:2468_t:CDS:1 n=1 Tax=Acaulospora morrowiae TaxID=94023 RepID=A0A9N9BU77_9GLOM|nr:2468_t:CDS:1 [Acaulospora morrowiae]
MNTDLSTSPLPPFPQSEASEDYQSFMESIKPPYPPRLKPQDLLPKLQGGKIRKIPNAFITYRKELCSNLKTKNICLTMSDASFWASKLWYKESTKVRMTYQNLTMQAKVINEKMSKSPKRPKVKDNNAGLQGRPSTDHNASVGEPMHMHGTMQTTGGETIFDGYRVLCSSPSTAEQSSSTASWLYQNPAHSLNSLYVPPTSQFDHRDSPLYLSPMYFPSTHFPYDAQQTSSTSEEIGFGRKIQEACDPYYYQ